MFGSNVRSECERSNEFEICVVFTFYALKICLAQMIEVNVNAQMNFNFCVVFTNYALKICLAQMLKNSRHKLSRILELRFKEAYNREKNG